MFEAFYGAFKREIESVRGSFYRVGLLTFFPLLSFALVVAIFYKGIAYEMPVIAVDLDKTPLSRDLLFEVDASATINIKYRLNNLAEAKRVIKSSKAYALFIVPKNFSQDIYRLKQPKITVMVNTQYILIGKTLKAAFVDALRSSAQKFKRELFYKSSTLEDQSAAIELQVTPFFNSSKNYFYFLVSALLPSIWQIFIVIGVIVSFGTMFKAKQEREFFKGGHILAKIFGKLFLYTLAYMLLGLGFIYYLYIYLGWEFQGSFGFLVIGMFCSLLAYEAAALFLFVTSFDYARALSLGAFYTAPAFAFLGITFPVDNMNSFALFYRELLPISTYIELQISQANYGAPIGNDIGKVLNLLLFLLLFIPVYIRFKQRLSQ